MANEPHVRQIVHAGAAQSPVGQVEARRFDHMDFDAEAGAESQDGAGVLRNVGLVEGKRDHEGPWINARMRGWFENLIAPLVEAPVARPPDTLIAFYRYFLAPVRGTIVAVLAHLARSAPSTEMGLFVFLGWIVDQATTTPQGAFFHALLAGPAGMALVILSSAR